MSPSWPCVSLWCIVVFRDTVEIVGGQEPHWISRKTILASPGQDSCWGEFSKDFVEFTGDSQDQMSFEMERFLSLKSLCPRGRQLLFPSMILVGGHLTVWKGSRGPSGGPWWVLEIRAGTGTFFFLFLLCLARTTPRWHELRLGAGLQMGPK